MAVLARACVHQGHLVCSRVELINDRHAAVRRASFRHLRNNARVRQTRARQTGHGARVRITRRADDAVRKHGQRSAPDAISKCRLRAARADWPRVFFGSEKKPACGSGSATPSSSSRRRPQLRALYCTRNVDERSAAARNHTVPLGYPSGIGYSLRCVVPTVHMTIPLSGLGSEISAPSGGCAALAAGSPGGFFCGMCIRVLPIFLSLQLLRANVISPPTEIKICKNHKISRGPAPYP